MNQSMKVRVRTALFTAALVLSGSGASVLAQGEATVTGQVVARVDGSPIAGVSVSLRSAATQEAVQTTSEPTGRFTFHLVVPGQYLLSCAADGFSTAKVALTLEPREVRTLSLALELRPLVTSVEVGAEAPRLASTHSPSSTVLTLERLETLPATHLNNLPEAIVAAAPGMIRGHDDFVHIRGHEVALNPVINGVSFWENPHSLFSAGLSAAVVDTINVLTGGFPAEYGNRFGGVLDVVTKSGQRMQNEGSFEVSMGQAGRRSVAADFGGHRGWFGYYLFGSGFASERFLSPPDPTAIDDEGRGARVFAQLDGNSSETGMLRLILMANGANFEIPRHPRDVSLRPGVGADQRTREQSAILGWTRAWSAMAVSTSIYQRYSSARLFPTAAPLSAIARHERTLVTLGGKADVTHVVGRHVVKAGIDAVRLRPEEELTYDYAGFRDFTHLLGWPHIHLSGGPVSFAGRKTGGQVSAYVQDRMQLGQRVSADIGLRLDRYELLVSATHPSPRVNVAFELGAGTQLHASYNHFFVPPPIEGVLSSSAGLTARIAEIGLALPPLEPTTEDQVELGIGGRAGALRLGLTGYYRVTDNPVHTTVWPDSRVYSYASFDRQRAYGLELKVELPPLSRYGVSGYLNYALGRVNFYNPVTGGFVTEAAHIHETSRFRAPMDQTHTLTAGATYRHARSGVWIGSMVEYGSGTPMGHGDGDLHHGDGEADHQHAAAPAGAPRVPSHITANLSAGIDLLRDARRRGRFSLQLDVENLTNDVYLIAQEGEFSPAQYAIPRLITGKLKVRF